MKGYVKARVAETCSSNLSSYLNLSFSDSCNMGFVRNFSPRGLISLNLCDMLQQQIFAKMPCPLMCTTVQHVLATDSYWDQSQTTTSVVKRNPTKQIITDVIMADGRIMPVPVFVVSAAPTWEYWSLYLPFASAAAGSWDFPWHIVIWCFPLQTEHRIFEWQFRVIWYIFKHLKHLRWRWTNGNGDLHVLSN